jgi:hypothetical protein
MQARILALVLALGGKQALQKNRGELSLSPFWSPSKDAALPKKRRPRPHLS